MNNLSYSTQRKIILIGFLALPLALLALFTYYPAVRLVVQSFTDWDGISDSSRWIGFVLVWAALAVLSVDLLRNARRTRTLEPALERV